MNEARLILAKVWRIAKKPDAQRKVSLLAIRDGGRIQAIHAAFWRKASRPLGLRAECRAKTNRLKLLLISL
jgi:hypothetical protein